MRVVLAVHMFLPKYSAGTEVLTLETARRLQAKGHEVAVLTAEPVALEEAVGPPTIYREDYQDIPVYRIKHHPRAAANPVRAEYANDAFYEPIQDLLVQLRPALVHVLHPSRLSGMVVHAAKDLGLPVAYTPTDFWVACPTCQLRRHDQSMCSGPNKLATDCTRCYVNRTQPPWVQRLVNTLPTWAIGWINRLCRLPLAEWSYPTRSLRALLARSNWTRQMLRRCDRILAPTRLMHNVLRRHGAPAERMQVLSYGLNVEHTNAHQHKTWSRTLRFAFMGTLAEHKGAHLLVQAFRQLTETAQRRPVELQIWGDPTRHGEYGAELQRLAADCPAIRFCGTFPNARIGQVFAEIDLLVVPSVWYENTPLVIYSAFATRTPVIATDLGGMAEVVRHEVNGLLFPLNDIAALADRMRRCVNEPALLKRLRTGIEPVKNMDDHITELETLYQQLAESRGRAHAA